MLENDAAKLHEIDTELKALTERHRELVKKRERLAKKITRQINASRCSRELASPAWGLKERIECFAREERSFNLSEAYDHCRRFFPGLGMNNVSATLSKLKAEGVLDSPGRGRYRYVEEREKV